jgi:ATP-dependent DNA helicase DinG
VTHTTLTPSITFETIRAELGLAHRPGQDRAVSDAHDAVLTGQRVIIQAPTGIGKSYVALSTAADAGVPGAPGMVLTTSNALGDQYLRDAARMAAHIGFRYTRVMGAAHYACADSTAAREAGIPGWDQVATADGEVVDEALVREAQIERAAWLDSFHRANPDPAVRDEWRNLARAGQSLDPRYACLGYPSCAGTLLEGCGSKRARIRAHHVHVVITNFHLPAFAYKLRELDQVALLPWREARVMVVDEAHKLPDVLAEVAGGRITERTGNRLFGRNHPELATAVHTWITRSLDAVVWPTYDSGATETPVAPDPEGLAAFVAAWDGLPQADRLALNDDQAEDEGDAGSGDVLGLLRGWALSARSGTPWAAWTTRQWRNGGWQPGGYTDRNGQFVRTMYLRRADAAAQIIPALLPRAAVLMSGTIGQTLPARLGLPGIPVQVLPQEFDWSTVTGWISNVDGQKTRRGKPVPGRDARDRRRAVELAQGIARHGGALVLANSHADAWWLRTQLRELLPDYAVMIAEEGGSLPAERQRAAFVAHRQGGGRAILIGSDSFATGLDLPGELCTFVAWWVCFPSRVGVYERVVADRFRPAGDYLAEQHRIRFAQGVGRLLRTATDRGEVMICDSRAWEHLRHLDRVDAHLAKIQWQPIPSNAE